MTSEFRVMDWLREVRERNVKEESGMSVAERLGRTEKEARGLLEQMLESTDVTIRQVGQQQAKGAASKLNR